MAFNKMRCDTNFLGKTIVCACAIAAPSVMGTAIKKVKKILSILSARDDTGKFKRFSESEKKKFPIFWKQISPKLLKYARLIRFFLMRLELWEVTRICCLCIIRILKKLHKCRCWRTWSLYRHGWKWWNIRDQEELIKLPEMVWHTSLGFQSTSDSETNQGN